MKIRTGFVSNSSSSSFLIYGIYEDTEELTNILVRNNKMANEKDFYKWLEEKEVIKLFKNNGIEPFYGPEDWFACGASWDNVGDDETGKQFKERVEKGIKAIFGDNVTCNTATEAWRDD